MDHFIGLHLPASVLIHGSLYWVASPCTLLIVEIEGCHLNRWFTQLELHLTLMIRGHGCMQLHWLLILRRELTNNGREVKISFFRKFRQQLLKQSNSRNVALVCRRNQTILHDMLITFLLSITKKEQVTIITKKKLKIRSKNIKNKKIYKYLRISK